ncbi:MAG: hypothetical protein QOJ06_150 [Pseudonocardiales bacterium]|jgi:hypothetical protein|nr:hypothetical protein [Pseudonocardiales bacterium]
MRRAKTTTLFRVAADCLVKHPEGRDGVIDADYLQHSDYRGG